jgi:phage/plasmid-associated DNA primase
MGVAGILKQFYEGSLYYTKSHGWLYWDNTKWNIGNESMIFYPICKRISSELCLYINVQLDKKKARVGELSLLPKDDPRRGLLIPAQISLEEGKQAFNRYRHLQSVSAMKSILQMSMSLFQDDEILSTFDCQPQLFSFTDISINLFTQEPVTFTKEQRILTTCGYKMPPRNQEYMDKVEILIKEITDDFVGFMANMAILLYGGNINEVFLVWKGIGRNGKGVTDTLVRQVLGIYMMTLPITELTQESKGKGGANSEIANLRWARCVMSVEPEEHQKLQTGRIKQLTGNDPIDARQLFKEAFKYLPKFTLVLQCNAMPRLTKLDDAIENRMIVTEYPFQFVEEPIRDYQRKVDITIKGKLSNDSSYRDGMLWLLLDAFKESQGKIIRTDKHKEQLAEIIEDNSPLCEFLQDYETSVNFIRINELYGFYSINHNTKIKKAEFKKHITNHPKIKCEEDKSNGMKVFLKRK